MLAALLILVSIASTGCTAIGFGAGALIDMETGKGPPGRLWGVRSGIEITMWLRDGSKLNGIYRGNQAASRVTAPVQEASADPLAVPLGDVILLETHQGVQGVPAKDVLRVSVPVARGKVTGTLVGLAADALVVVAAWAAAGTVY